MAIRRPFVGEIGLTVRGAKLLSQFGLTGAKSVTAFHRFHLMADLSIKAGTEKRLYWGAALT
jgi:hypothetical protein